MKITNSETDINSHGHWYEVDLLKLIQIAEANEILF